jgi:hypothetical protein
VRRGVGSLRMAVSIPATGEAAERMPIYRLAKDAIRLTPTIWLFQIIS